MEEQTLDGIYKAHFIDVYRYLLSICHDHDLAEDLVQETFLRAYLYLEECPPEKIKPWLFRVAHNVLVDGIRKQKRTQPQEHEFFELIAAESDPVREVLQHEQLRELELALQCLPEKRREAIVLVDLNGLSYAEASEIMGVTPAYFKVLLFRARQMVRELHKGDEHVE